MGKKIGQGFNSMFEGGNQDTGGKKKTETKAKNKKEGFYIYMSDDLKVRLQLHKVKTKATLSDIVEAAVSKYLDTEEKKQK